MPPSTPAVLLLGGEILTFPEAWRNYPIACADSGADHARRFDLPVKAIIGDLDSISDETLRHYEASGSKIVRMSGQDDNDFEKALRHLLEKNVRDLRLLGMTGGRADHTLTNFSVMLRYTDQFEQLVAVDAFGEHRFLTAAKNTLSFEAEVGSTVSLTPYGEAHGVETGNLQYALNSESLTLGQREGLSNVVTGAPVTISIASGALLVSVLSKS